MGRVIKFRAWDKEQKTMFFDTIAGIPSDPEWKGQVFIGCEGYFEGELMQFTGLKDCKGVEIYEGDILSDESQMQWCNTCVGFRPHWMMTELICHSCDGNYFIWEMDFTEISIIGNIYENPELIEG